MKFFSLKNQRTHRLTMMVCPQQPRVWHVSHLCQVLGAAAAATAEQVPTNAMGWKTY